MKRLLKSNCLLAILLLMLITPGFVYSQSVGLKSTVVTSFTGVVGSVNIKSLNVNETGTSEYITPSGSTGFNLTNVLTLSFIEETSRYLTDNVKVTVGLEVKYGTNASNAVALSAPVELTVSYAQSANTNYDNKNYYYFYDAPYVSVKILSITSAVSSVNGIDIRDLLRLDNEIRVSQRYDLNDGVSPLGAGVSLSTPGVSDELKAEWNWPSNAGNNGTQIEWTWVEKDEEKLYEVQPGVLDHNLLFQSGATRVDLDYNKNNYIIPLYYPGEGDLYVRIRPVNYDIKGGVTTGNWTVPVSYHYNGHEVSFNWQSRTSYAEEGKRKTVMEYFDGSLRSRQTVTKDNVTNRPIVAETLYDKQGRAAVQILPAPTVSDLINKPIKYFNDLNRFNGQSQNEDPANIFDLKVAVPAIPALMNINGGSSQYYSASNLERLVGENAYVPNAEGYPYTYTQYMPDATGRILLQTGVGAKHNLGSGHETKYYYGTPAQEDLDALFGIEAGYVSHYTKNMVSDANGQMSVSYVDKTGKTVATALAGNSPSNLEALNMSTYANTQLQNTVTRDLLYRNNTIKPDGSIESISSLLVPVTINYQFKYNFNAEAFAINIPELVDGAVVYKPKCYDCKYTVMFTVINEQTGESKYSNEFNNLQANPSTACPLVNSAPFSGVDGNITFTIENLAPGSYIVRKTLKIDEASLAAYKQDYLDRTLIKTEQMFIDEVLVELKAASNCETSSGAVLDCTTCTTALGTQEAFQLQYLASIGKTLTDYANDPALAKEITLSYTKREQQCKELCGTVSNDALTMRDMMLADMIPLTGQYARGSASSVNCTTYPTPIIFNKYDIFYETSGVIAKFKRPLDIEGDPGDYFDAEGNVDHFFLNNTLVIDYEHSKYGNDGALYKEQYIENFKQEWAASLLPHHPEYNKLKAFEEMTGANLWFEKFKNTETYAAALTNNFLKADGTGKVNVVDNGLYLLSDLDPFFDESSSLRSLMAGYLRVSHPDFKYNSSGSQKFNLWHLANYSIRCRSVLAATQDACYTSTLVNLSNKYPFEGLSIQEKDLLWKTFKGLYVSIRNKMLYEYLNTESILPSADRNALICQGYKLHFATNDNLAAMFPDVFGMLNPTYTRTDLDNDVITKYAEQQAVNCEEYKNYWIQMFNDCDQINQKELLVPGTKQIILNEILEGFKEICEASDITGGSSSLESNASENFEKVVKDVFSHYNISFSALCHPYNVLTPEPYGMGRKLVRDVIYKVSKCECDKFTAKYNLYLNNNPSEPKSFEGFNSYLTLNSFDNISLSLYETLRNNCYKICNPPVLIQGEGEPPVEEATLCEEGREYINLQQGEVVPDFLACNVVPVQVCYTCNDFKNFHTAFKSEFAGVSSVANEVLFGNTASSVAATDLFVKYVNFKTGFKWLTRDYYNFLSTKGCNLVSGGTVVVVCRSTKPLTDLPKFAPEDPCRDVKRQSELIGRERYESYVKDLSENFEKLYRAKCTPAVNKELFTVTYTNKEYHYTLYYYDQAGNLVKTVPPKGVKPETSVPYLSRVKAARENNTVKITGTNNNVPSHTFVTVYNYNTLNQVISQTTPDAGLSRFWYDKLGRLVISQNAQQFTGDKYSYTLYDKLGRIIEVGEKRNTAEMDDLTAMDPVDLMYWFNSDNTANPRTQITRTYYDQAKIFGVDGPGEERFGQRYLRNRVSYSTVITSDNIALANINEFGAGTNHNNYQTATYYDYDLHGNVSNLLHDYRVGVMSSTYSGFNRYKVISYKYDLISGKVNEVAYQPDFTDATNVLRSFKDAYRHRYEYDADNKLTRVFTSKDSIYWERDAEYKYYQHGALARMELGQMRVQGLDYVYTIHGWLKGVNATVSSESREPGLDGNIVASNNANKLVGRDVFGYSLNYYVGDYKPINATNINVHIRFPDGSAANPLYNLYNGNIRAMSTHFGGVSLKSLNGAAITEAGANTTYLYLYDQLNRLTKSRVLENYTSIYLQSSGYLHNLENMTYDPNGNILTLYRKGIKTDGSIADMDNLTYNYPNANNKLTQVTDLVSSGDFAEDIDGQGLNNYLYDNIGNLKSDAKELITAISWNVYGKIANITKAGNAITYSYDAGGNRISKTTSEGTTWYVRDAQGNTMAVYFTKGTTLKHIESHMYGSSRLGVHNTNTTVDGYVALGASMPIPGKTGNYTGKTGNFTRGNKFFELTNHLGNVLMTVSDRKLQVPNAANTLVSYYKAEVMTATDYYPFGSPIPGRSFKREGERGNANNVVHKTSFDNGLDGWVTYGGSSTVTLDNGRVKVSASNPWGTAMKVLNLKAGKTYKISFTIEMGSCTAISMPFYLAPGATPAYQWSSPVTGITASGSYTTYFTPTVSYYRWLFETLGYTGSEGYFWLDDILVEEVVDGDGEGSLESNGYRYGFNGQEKSDEIKGNGNSYTAEYWQYDPRLGRRWNVDPVVKPFESSYAAFGNRPILMVDPNGADWYRNNETKKARWFEGNGTQNGYSYLGDENYVFEAEDPLENVTITFSKRSAYNRQWRDAKGLFSQRVNTGKDPIQPGDNKRYVDFVNNNYENFSLGARADADYRKSSSFVALTFAGAGLLGPLTSAAVWLPTGVSAAATGVNNLVIQTNIWFNSVYFTAGTVAPKTTLLLTSIGGGAIKMFDETGAFNSVRFGAVPRIFNTKGVAYPRVIVDGFGEVPFPNGPFTPNNSKTLRSFFTPKLKADFKDWWIAQGRAWPNVPEGSTLNIHHIKPLSKGGTNSFDNLIPLIQPEEHQPFTNWWRSY